MENIDRTEFLKRLDQSFDPMFFCNEKDCLRALIFNDTAFLDKVRTRATICATEKQKYISQYDAAPDKVSKEQVIGSVTLNNVTK